MRWNRIAASAALASMVTAACGGGAQPGGQNREEPERPPVQESELSITASDFAFDTGGVTSLPAGRVEFTMTNEGKEPHHAQLIKLTDGVTFEQFEEALDTSYDVDDPADYPDEALALMASPRGYGVLSWVSPGEELTPTDELEPGTYALLCAIESPETGERHYALGMRMAFEVT
jgi:hypothetical protein